jgi:hypothetical protein
MMRALFGALGGLMTKVFAMFSSSQDFSEAIEDAEMQGLIAKETDFEVLEHAETEEDVPFLGTKSFSDAGYGVVGGLCAGVLLAAAFIFVPAEIKLPISSLLIFGAVAGGVFGGIIGLLSGSQREQRDREIFMKEFQPGNKALLMYLKGQQELKPLTEVFRNHHATLVKVA